MKIKKIPVWLKLVLVYLAGILFVQKLSSVWLPNRTDFESPVKISGRLRSTVMPWLNFDGRNYLDITMKGYFQKGNNNLRAFFPLYPLLVRLLSVNLIFNPIYSGLVISISCFILGTCFFYRWTASRYNRETAIKSLILLLIFPTSFFFLAYYTESLFFLLTILFFYAVLQKKYWLSALFCALATATRIVGLALLPVLIYELWKRLHTDKIFPWELCLSPMGFVGFLVFNKLQTGNWTTLITSETTFSRQFTVWGPILTLWQGIEKIAAGPLSTYDSPFVYPVIIFEIIVLIYLVVIAVSAFKRLNTGLYIYLISSLGLLLISNILSSIDRYALMLFPIYIFLATRLTRRVFWLYTLGNCLLLAFFSSLFLRGYWVG